MRIKLLALAFALAAATLALPQTAALADTPPTASVLLSTDGSTFTPSLATGLFDFAGPLIPGGSAATTLFVRNPTDRPMVLDLGTSNITFSSREFADALSVIVTSDGSTAAPVTLGEAATCGVLLTGRQLAANATTRVDLALAMADVTGSTAQGQSASFDVRVGLHDAAGTAPADACDGPGVDIPGLSTGTGTRAGGAQPPLAHTGSDVWPPLLLGTGLLGAGLALLGARRRRHRA